MPTPPVLEDPSYPGRTGGYVARITGKLLHEAATFGPHRLFLPAPRSATTHYIYGGPDSSCPPLVQVPHEFYIGLYKRIKGIFGVGAESKFGERIVNYDGRPYTFRAKHVSSPVRGIDISIVVG